MAWPDPEWRLNKTMGTLRSGIAQATPEQRPAAIAGVRDHLKEARRLIGMYNHVLELNEQEAQANAVALTESEDSSDSDYEEVDVEKELDEDRARMQYYLRYNTELVPLLTQLLAEVEPGQAGAGVEYTHSNILALKDLRKRIRKGVPEERKQRSQLYADVLAVINSYYPNDGAAWRKTAELLPRMGRLESGGSDLAAGAISSALKLMLGNDLTRQNGLMLIQRIAKLSGSLTQDYRPVLRGLSKTLGFPLDLADGSKGMWDLIDVTDAGGIAVRQSTKRKRKRSDLDQKGGALSRKPPMRQAQIFTPGTEGVMFTQRAIRQRRREQAHRGASAEQQILAGTGVLPPPPGFHYMSTGELMANPE
jgi:hypothetical protein